MPTHKSIFQSLGFKFFNDNGYERTKANKIMYKFKLAEDAMGSGYSKHIFYPHEAIPGDAHFYVVFPLTQLISTLVCLLWDLLSSLRADVINGSP